MTTETDEEVLKQRAVSLRNNWQRGRAHWAEQVTELQTEATMSGFCSPEQIKEYLERNTFAVIEFRASSLEEREVLFADMMLAEMLVILMEISSRNTFQ